MNLDWLISLLTGPVIVAAVISAAVAVTGFFISRCTLLEMHREKLFADIDMAKRKVDLDLESAARKRQQELAEEVLAGFYEARDIMRYVRTPLRSAREAEEREKQSGESEATARARDSYFVPLSRYKKRSETINTLMSRRYRFSAAFGPEADKPFGDLSAAIERVLSASSILMDMANVSENHLPPDDAATLTKLRGAIWQRQSNDEIESALTTAISDMERICRPLLTARDKTV